jgi:hypothetical protein
MKYPKNFAPPPPLKLEKYDFFGVNGDFSHEIPQKFSRLPSLGAIFLSAPLPNLKSWNEATVVYFIPIFWGYINGIAYPARVR